MSDFPFIYEFEVELLGSVDNRYWTTTFVARSAARDVADTEAEVAARLWYSKLRETLMDIATPGRNVHIRQADYCHFDTPTLDRLVNSQYRFVKTVRID